MSHVIWYKHSDWFKQRPPNTALCSRVIIPYCYLLWGASRRNEFHYQLIQSAFEHGLQAGQLGPGACAYRGAQEVAWIRGYYYASQQDGSTTQSLHSIRLLSREWTRLRPPLRLTSSPTTLPQVISDIDYWCSDIEYLGSEWGRWMRYEPNPWYRDNHINRLYRESGHHYKVRAVTSDNLDPHNQNSYQSGMRNAFRDFRISASGASADTYGALGRNPASGSKKNFKPYGPKILAGFMSKDQLRFHRGYRGLEDIRQKEILWVYFVPEVTQERKLNLLKITQTEYDSLLDLALKVVTNKIEGIDAEALKNREAASRQTLQDPITQLWPSRIFSYVHKVAINDSRRNPFPICLSLTGHSNPKSPFVKGPLDPNIYCKRQTGELYAVVPNWEWVRLRRQGELDNHLTDLQESQGKPVRITQGTKPIRILRQTRKGQWLVGEDGNLKHIRKLKGLEHIVIAGQSAEMDALKAIWGLDNDAYLPAYSSEDSSDQKAMRGFQTPEAKILGIQSPEAQLQIKQMLVEFEEKIREADEEGLTDLCKQHKKDMADFKRLTKGSCIGKRRSRPADEGDIFRSILHNLTERRTSAMGVLRKAGLHDEADDLEHCYKIENRTAIVFASRSRFTWKFDRELK